MAVDGIRVGRTPATLDALLDRHRPGEIVRIHVFRRDELREFKVTLAAPSESDCVLEDLLSRAYAMIPDSQDYHAILVGKVPLLDVRAPIEFAQGSFPVRSIYR